MTYDDCLKRVVHIEDEADFDIAVGGYYIDVDIGDTVYICEEADVYMREDENGWTIEHGCDRVGSVDLEDGMKDPNYKEKARTAFAMYRDACNAALSGMFDEKKKKRAHKKPSFNYADASEVFDQVLQASEKERKKRASRKRR